MWVYEMDKTGVYLSRMICIMWKVMGLRRILPTLYLNPDTVLYNVHSSLLWDISEQNNSLTISK